MSQADIQRLVDEGVTSCMPTGTEDRGQSLAAAAQCLPMVVGTAAESGVDIEAVYVCSDVCPDAGGVIVRYVDVVEEDCCALGGVPMMDPAWGGYRGCSPVPTPAGSC